MRSMAAKIPKLAFDGSYFTGEAFMPAWDGFKVGGGKKRREKIMIEGEALVDEESDADPAPSEAHLEALRHLFENEAAVRDAAVEGLLAAYPKLRKGYAKHLDDPDVMPEQVDAKTLRSLIELQNVTLHNVALDGAVYVGLAFGCAWDEEHGAGVMMHRSRVVSAGDGDHAILDWIAEKDLKAQKRGKKPRPSPRKKAKGTKKSDRVTR